MYNVIVDGMLSGTGLRSASGGYLEPQEIGLSAGLAAKIGQWLARYEDAFFFQFSDKNEVELLDKEGVEIARLIRSENSKCDVKYFSNAKMTYMDFT